MASAVVRCQEANARLVRLPIELELKKLGSREIYLSVSVGSGQPDLTSPARRGLKYAPSTGLT
jgi:hypothetical protein